MPRDCHGLVGRLAALALLVLAGHAALTSLFPLTREEMAGRSHLQQLDALDACAASDQKTLVFLGDSVNFSYAAADRDRRRISEVLQEFLPQHRIATIDHRAYHAGVYRGFVHRISSREPKPGLVVVPVNLRSLTTHWTMNPGWQFAQLQRFLACDGPTFRLLFRPLRSLKLYGDSTLSEVDFSRLPVYDGDTRAGSVMDFQRIAAEPATKSNTRAMITYYYMERATNDNPRVHDFVAIAKMARARGLRVLFYITPTDFEVCDEALDGRFSARIKENAGVIKAALQREGGEVLDLSFALARDGFYYRSPYPDEHLNEKGRRIVAEHLAGWVGRGDKRKQGELL